MIDPTAVELFEESLALLGPADNPDRARTLGRLAETLYPDPSESSAWSASVGRASKWPAASRARTH